MSTAITISIGQMVVETADERQRAEGIPERLREAFELLAEKLRTAPQSRRLALRSRVLETLNLTTLPSEEILGPRGAERIAEELYRQIIQADHLQGRISEESS